MPTILAESSGVSLRERDGKLLIVDHGCGWVYTLGFVLAIVTFVVSANGLLQLGLVATGNGGLWQLGLILTAVGVGSGYSLKTIAAIPKRRRATPAEQLKVVAVVDRQAGMLTDGRGAPLAALAHVQLGTGFQIGSSSRRLVARWAGGELTLARGNPFAGGISALHEGLAARLGARR